MILLSGILLLLVIASFPYWLPKAVVAIRVSVFTRINGNEGIAIPGPAVDVSQFKNVYSHPAAGGRSQGAALSDLFWYWLAPGPEMHQEHLEAGERYDEVAQTTKRILAVPKKIAEEKFLESARRILGESQETKEVRLRDFVMPIWADFYYTLVFGEPCSAAARKLIVDNANDVVSALKMTSLRHMRKRERLTAYLVKKLEAGYLPDVLPTGFSNLERAYYLQGTFFNTAIVQMSEATAHLLLFLAENESVQSRLCYEKDSDRFLDYVVSESFRVHPLFGIAHRITTDAIEVEGHKPLPAGSVLCFNYQEFHQAGFENPSQFNPDRWEGLSQSEENYTPFGVAGNRACPAQAIALITLKTLTKEILRYYVLYSSVTHTRSLPNRGPCLIAKRGELVKALAFRLSRMRARDRWEDVGRSFAQLFYGTFMIWQARRLKLCRTFFEKQRFTPKSFKAEKSQCPFAWLAVKHD